ncbi:endonuclease NucS domain-containing protein [Pseudomonas sp. IzPS59]|uniref:endonuclease NucS domain-containing protein n=1 Tax=Pseudomonas sp. IzPS59 TaxID=2774459 RepID=UPI001787985D
MERIESFIRDKLALNLDILEEGLQLLDIESYLPNIQGTNGFIDLLAKDSNGKYVIIEIKRSKSASRDALHEVLKYLEGLKSKYSIRDSEIRVFIVSTEWKELLVPFSSFVKRTSVVTQGFSLEVDSDYAPIRSTPVPPVELTQDRLFAPWHELNLYESKASLEKGIASYETSCFEKEIENYVLLIITPSVEFKKRPARALAIIDLSLAMPALKLKKSPEQILAELPTYSHILYFAPLQLSEDACWHSIRKQISGEELKEFELDVSGMDESDKLFHLHEKLYELTPSVFFEDAEIGTPAKLSKLLDGDGAEIIEVRRYGTLDANKFLSNDSIIEDLRGADGNRPQSYYKQFIPSNRAELSEVRTSIQRCLEDNPLWRNQLIRVMDEFLPKSNNFKATLSIYNPGNFCLSLFKSIDDPKRSYIPNYSLAITENDILRCVFIGSMWPTGKKASFTKMLNEFYENSGRLFLSTLNWGGYDSRDVEISDALGMTYKTFKIEFNGDDRTFWELTDIKWKAHAELDEASGFRQFKQNNKSFVTDVCEYYLTHWDGVLVKHDLDEKFEFRT